MTTVAVFAAFLVMVGTYLVLSERSRKKLLGAGLLVQAVPMTVFLTARGEALAEGLILAALLIAAAVFFVLILLSGEGLDLHADDD